MEIDDYEKYIQPIYEILKVMEERFKAIENKIGLKRKDEEKKE